MARKAATAVDAVGGLYPLDPCAVDRTVSAASSREVSGNPCPGGRILESSFPFGPAAQGALSAAPSATRWAQR